MRNTEREHYEKFLIEIYQFMRQYFFTHEFTVGFKDSVYWVKIEPGVVIPKAVKTFCEGCVEIRK